jgi:hypothetical protein
MHKSLYEIQAEYSNLVANLEDMDGELTEEMELAMLINQDELTNKAEAYALRIIQFNGEEEMLKAEADRLSKRAAAVKRTADRLKEMIKSAMIQFNVPKIKTPKVTLSLRKSEKLDLPENFIDSIVAFTTIQPVLNVEKIQQALTEAAEKDCAPPFLPTDELLQYLKIKTEADGAKIKAALKEGTSVGDCSLVSNQSLQIK